MPYSNRLPHKQEDNNKDFLGVDKEADQQVRLFQAQAQHFLVVDKEADQQVLLFQAQVQQQGR